MKVFVFATGIEDGIATQIVEEARVIEGRSPVVLRCDIDDFNYLMNYLRCAIKSGDVIYIKAIFCIGQTLDISCSNIKTITDIGARVVLCEFDSLEINKENFQEFQSKITSLSGRLIEEYP